MKHLGIRATRDAGKAPELASLQKETLSGHICPGLANAERGQHRPPGGYILLHEDFERLTDAMNCLRRHNADAVSERFICRRASERGALHERLTKTVFHHFIHSICCLIDRVSG